MDKYERKIRKTEIKQDIALGCSANLIEQVSWVNRLLVRDLSDGLLSVELLEQLAELSEYVEYLKESVSNL